MKFALILTLFAPNGSYYAVETDLSATECELRAEYYETIAAELFIAGDYILTCEMDDSHED